MSMLVALQNQMSANEEKQDHPTSAKNHKAIPPKGQSSVFHETHPLFKSPSCWHKCPWCTGVNGHATVMPRFAKLSTYTTQASMGDSMGWHADLPIWWSFSWEWIFLILTNLSSPCISKHNFNGLFTQVLAGFGDSLRRGGESVSLSWFCADRASFTIRLTLKEIQWAATANVSLWRDPLGWLN